MVMSRSKCLCHCVFVENKEQTMTGIPELFSGRISVVHDVAFGHVCSAVRMNHGSRSTVLVWRLLVEMPAYTLSNCLRVLCALVSMHDA